jgi:formylglycine-generating enzyme required for sulfatase activity
MSQKSDETMQRMMQHRRDSLNAFIGWCRARVKQYLRAAVVLLIVSAMMGLPVMSGQVGPKAPPPKPPRSKPTPPKQPSGRATASNRGTKKPARASISNEITNAVNWEGITAGEFMMGSENGDADEKPAHRVRISRSFEMGKCEVTQAQWKAVGDSNPSRFKGANLPVENVSWDDVQRFIQRLNERNGDYVYRLPTEAEWEYACRAGNAGDYAGDLDAMAWYDKNSRDTTHPVGTTRQPNPWGLYDMHGNVWEWCQDSYNKSYYSQSPDLVIDPQNSTTNSLRVIRGGSWSGIATELRSANRYWFAPNTYNRILGFRLVRTLR